MVEYIVFFGLIGIVMIAYLTFTMRMRGVVVETSPYIKELNKTESPIERRVYNALWHRNHSVTCQYPVGRYRLDMAIVSHKIAIECDGKDYHSSPQQKAHDRKRDNYLRSQGWKVLRFSGSQINRNMSSVIKKIESEINKNNPTN